MEAPLLAADGLEAPRNSFPDALRSQVLASRNGSRDEETILFVIKPPTTPPFERVSPRYSGKRGKTGEEALSPRDGRRRPSGGSRSSCQVPSKERCPSAASSNGGREAVPHAVTSVHHSGSKPMSRRRAGSSSASPRTRERDRVAFGRGPNLVFVSADSRDEEKASGEEDSTAEVLLEHADEVKCVAFSADGHLVLAGGEDSILALWDVESRTRRFEVKLSSGVVALAYCPGGVCFAAADGNSTVIAWRTDTHEETGKVQVTSGKALSLALVAWPHPLLAVGTTENVLLFTTPSLQEVVSLHHDGDVRGLSFSPSSGLLAGGGGGRDLYDGLLPIHEGKLSMSMVIWRVADKPAGCCLMGSVPFPDIVHVVAFSPNGRLLAAAGEDRQVSCLLVEGAFEMELELRCPANVRCLAWTPDSNFLASGGEDMQVTVWSVVEGLILMQLKHEDWICSVAFSGNGRWIAYCGFGQRSVGLRRLRVVEKKGEATREVGSRPLPAVLWITNTESVTVAQQVALTPRRRSKKSRESRSGRSESRSDPSSAEEQAEAEEIAEWRLVVKLQPASGGAAELQQPPSRLRLEEEVQCLSCEAAEPGRRVFASGMDGQVVVWDSHEGTRLFERGLSGQIKASALHPDGRFFAIADNDNFIQLWDAASYEELASSAVNGDVCCLAMCGSRFGILAAGTAITKVMPHVPGAEASWEMPKVVLLSLPDLDDLTELTFGVDVHSLHFSSDSTRLVAGGGFECRQVPKDCDRSMKVAVWKVAAIEACSSSDDEVGENLCELIGEATFGRVVWAVAHSPTSELIAVGAEDHSLWLLEPGKSPSGGLCKTRELLVGGAVRALSWSSDARMLASAGEDMHITIWDSRTWNKALLLPKASDWYSYIGFLGSDLLASCTMMSSSVALHRLDVSEEVKKGPTSSTSTSRASIVVRTQPSFMAKRSKSITFAASILESEKVTAVAVKNSRSERRATSCLMMGLGSLALLSAELELPPGEPKASLKHDDEVTALSFAPDGEWLLTGTENGSVVLWELDKASLSESKKLFVAKRSDPIAAVTFSPDGSFFAVAAGETIVVVSASNHQLLHETCTEGEVLSLATRSAPGRQILAAGLKQGMVEIRLLPSLDEIVTLAFGGPVKSLSFRASDGLLAAGGGRGSRKSRSRPVCTSSMSDYTTCAPSYTSTGTVVESVQVTADSGPKVVVWNDAFDALAEIPYMESVNALEFGPSGKLLAIGTGDGKISLLQADHKFVRGPEYESVGGCQCLSWSRDSRYLAAGGEDMRITVWDLLAEKLAFKLPKAEDWISRVAFAPGEDSILAMCCLQSDRVALAKLQAQEERTTPQKMIRSRSSESFKNLVRQGKEVPKEKSEKVQFQIPVRGVARPSQEGSESEASMSRNSSGSPSRVPPACVPSITINVVPTSSKMKSPMKAKKGSLTRPTDSGESSCSDTECLPLSLAAQHLPNAASNESRPCKPSNSRRPPMLSHSAAVNAFAFSPSGDIVATGGEGKELQCWIASIPQQIARCPVEHALQAICWARSSKFVVTVDEVSEIVVWTPPAVPTDWRSGVGNEFADIERVGSRMVEDGKVAAIACCYRPLEEAADGDSSASSSARPGACEEELLVVGGCLPQVLVFSMPTLQQLLEIRHDQQVISSISASLDGSLIAAACIASEAPSPQLLVWALQTQGDFALSVVEQGFMARGSGSQVGGQGGVGIVAFAPQGRLLALGGNFPGVQLFAVPAAPVRPSAAGASGSSEASIGPPIDANTATMAAMRLEKVVHLTASSEIRCMAWSQAGRFLAAADQEFRITVWDVLSAVVRFKLPKANASYVALSFGLGGACLATLTSTSGELALLQLRDEYASTSAGE